MIRNSLRKMIGTRTFWNHISGYYIALISFDEYLTIFPVKCTFCDNIFVNVYVQENLLTCGNKRNNRTFDLVSHFYCAGCFGEFYNEIMEDITYNLARFFNKLEKVFVNKSLFEC